MPGSVGEGLLLRSWADSGRLVARLLVVAAGLLPCRAQMSPGDLSQAHRELDSPLRCVSCHEFGAGAAQFKCLQCHEEIARRLAEKRGYHAKVVRGTGRQAANDCSRCHSEHNGRRHQLVRWRTPKLKFDHKEAGWPLEGKHARARCEQCHNESRITAEDRVVLKRSNLSATYAGLSPRCTACHQDEHRGDLGKDCTRCHTLEGWKPASGFDHGKAAFVLTGRHEQLACEKCHKRLAALGNHVQFKNFGFFNTCRACHQDPHGGSFAGDCEKCHTTAGWKPARLEGGFQHDKTGFPLKGRHAAVECRKCHQSENFRAKIPHGRCLDCHEDRHRGQLAAREGGECGACHTETGWKPARFGTREHAGTRFPLNGRHAPVECAKCHAGQGAGVNYHPAFASCRDCHQDRHRGQFAGAPYENRCERCHTDGGWQAARYTLADHQKGRFALLGAHAAVPCGECHRAGADPADRPFHFGSLDCQQCHADPHRTVQAAAAGGRLSPAAARWGCPACHTTRTWKETGPFDHGRTDFALTGKHRGAPCTGCHKPAVMGEKKLVSFAGTARACGACHGDAHDGQFAGLGGTQPDCARCHETSNWRSNEFGHRRNTNFSLAGAHERVPCRMCHANRRQVEGRMVVLYRGTPRSCEECHR